MIISTIQTAKIISPHQVVQLFHYTNDRCFYGNIVGDKFKFSSSKTALLQYIQQHQ